MPTVPIAERLAVYGLKEPPKGQVRALRLRRGQRLELNRRRPPAGARFELARPRTLAELKLMVGVPDRAFRRPKRPAEFNLPGVTAQGLASLEVGQRLNFQKAIRTFVYSHTATVAVNDRKMIEDVMTLKPQFSFVALFQFADVFVASGATLVVEPGAVLFANNITVEQGGAITFGDYCKIDCNSFTGL